MKAIYINSSGGPNLDPPEGAHNKPFLALLLSLLVFCCSVLFIASAAEAAADMDTLARKAVFYNYNSYQQGQALDAYDIWVLEKAGAGVGEWIHDGKSIKTKNLAKIEEILNNPDIKAPDYSGSLAYSHPSKEIAQLNLLARIWGEDDKAIALIRVLQNRLNAAGNGSIDGNPFGDISAFEYLALSGDLHQMNAASAIDYILACSDPATGAWTSSWNDVMATAQAARTLKQLAVLEPGKADDINNAVTKALNFLQVLQKDNGSFQDAGGWDDPLLDSVEILLTLKAWGIDPEDWKSGEGKSIVDYLHNEALNADGSFGSTGNTTDATWVLNACLSLGVQIAPATPLGVSISPASASIEKDETAVFKACLELFDGRRDDISGSVSWLMADNDIASVNAGLVQGLKPGQTTLTATLNDYKASAAILVNPRKGGGESPRVTVIANIAVVGKDGSLLFGPSTVSISPKDRFGLTAMGALNRTGLGWSLSEHFAGFIIEIGGERNQGMAGWMYSLNGRVPGISASEQAVSDGDRVIFWYSEDALAGSPGWEDLGNSPIAKEKKERPPEEKEKLPELEIKPDEGLPTPAARVHFSDVDESLGWAKDAIEILAGKGIISGRGEHFDPLTPVSRAEFIALIARAFGSSSNEYTGITPNDVKPMDWFYPSLQFCLREGIVSGYPDGSFRPGDTISRQEIACILYRLKKESRIAGIPLSPSFRDEDAIAPWALGAIKELAALKVMQGYEDGRFQPEQACSRAEAAVILFRYLESTT